MKKKIKPFVKIKRSEINLLVNVLNSIKESEPEASCFVYELLKDFGFEWEEEMQEYADKKDGGFFKELRKIHKPRSKK